MIEVKLKYYDKPVTFFKIVDNSGYVNDIYEKDEAYNEILRFMTPYIREFKIESIL